MDAVAQFVISSIEVHIPFQLLAESSCSFTLGGRLGRG